MIAMQLVGTEQTSHSINCIIHVLPILAGYALAMVFLRHYFARTAGGTIAGRVIGVLLAVPVGNWAARTFIEFFPNLADDARAGSFLLLVFMGLCVFICLNLITEVGHPPSVNPPTGIPGRPLSPGGSP